MRTRVIVTGPDRWAVQGLAHALESTAGGDALEVHALPGTRPPQADADVLVALHLSADQAAHLDATLPAALPVLWIGHAPATTARITGHLSGDTDEGRVALAVQALAAGLLVFEPALRPASLPAATGVPPADPLTPRELEVFELLAKGLANRDIALALGISAHTAKFHVAQILEKMGAATRMEAVRQGLRLGLIGL